MKKQVKYRASIQASPKSKAGRRYYIQGERVYGWYKVGNYWYHFDENGCADTGRTKICGAYYTFDSKGRWTGKVSKNGLAPSDFKLTLESSYGMSAFDTDGYIYYGEDYDDKKYTADVKFPARDRQIFYCMLLESGFANGKNYDFGGSYLYGFSDEYLKSCENKELTMYDTEPQTVYTLKYTCDGKTGSVKFGYDSKQLMHIDEDCFSAYRFADGIADYRISWLYKKFPQPEGVDWVTLE